MDAVTKSDLHAVHRQLAGEDGVASVDALLSAFTQTGTRIQSGQTGREEVEELVRCATGDERARGLNFEAFEECSNLFPAVRRMVGKMVQQQFSPMTRKRRTRQTGGVLVPIIREEARESPALSEQVSSPARVGEGRGGDAEVDKENDLRTPPSPRAAAAAASPTPLQTQMAALRVQAHVMASPVYSPLLLTTEQRRAQGLEPSAGDKKRRQRDDLVRQIAERSAARAMEEAAARGEERREAVRLRREQRELAERYRRELEFERPLRGPGGGGGGVGEGPAGAPAVDAGADCEDTRPAEAPAAGATEAGPRDEAGPEEAVPPPKGCGCVVQ